MRKNRKFLGVMKSGKMFGKSVLKLIYKINLSEKIFKKYLFTEQLLKQCLNYFNHSLFSTGKFFYLLKKSLIVSSFTIDHILWYYIFLYYLFI